MRKIVFTTIVFIFTLCSCGDMLELTPKDRISETSVWADQTLIELYVNSSYHAVEHGFYQNIWACGFGAETYTPGVTGHETVLKGNLTADNVVSVDPGDSYLKLGLLPKLNYWKDAYSKIRDINIFFSKIDDAPIDEVLKKRMKGEMKFIRAFVYANLIWRYGGVPLVTSTFELNDDFVTSRETYDKCVDFLVAELDEAASLLPAQQPAAQLGRASGSAALALKSRVLLYAASPLNNPGNAKAKWEKAAKAAEALLTSGHALHNDYQKLFLENNNEIIFARYFSQANSMEINKTCGRNGDHGWGIQNAPTQNLVNQYEMKNGELPYLDEAGVRINQASGFDPAKPYINRDPRFEASILHDGSFWMGRETETFTGGMDSNQSSIEPWNASLTSYYLKKFIDPSIAPVGSNTKPTSPYIFMRFAEVLLNYSEALFELGDEVNARKYLNMVRARNGVDMPPVTAAGNELRKKIQHERRIELAFEGHRFYDVRRWKIAGETEKESILGMRITKLADGSRSYVAYKMLDRSFLEQHYLVPIPRAEVDKSKGSLVQNPGY